MLLQRVEILRTLWGAEYLEASGHVQRGDRIPFGYDRLTWEAALATSGEISFVVSGRRTTVLVSEIQSERFQSLCHMTAADFSVVYRALAEKNARDATRIVELRGELPTVATRVAMLEAAAKEYAAAKHRIVEIRCELQLLGAS